MSERQIAFLEAALLCSRYADNLRADHPDWADVATECSKMIEDEADSPVKTYPPGKPVIDLDQDFENSSIEKTDTYWTDGTLYGYFWKSRDTVSIWLFFAIAAQSQHKSPLRARVRSFGVAT